MPGVSAWLRNVVLGRADWSDVLVSRVRELFDDYIAPDMPEREGLDGLKLTPLERLERDVKVARDFRDQAKWPRDHEYPTSRYGWPKNKKRGRPHGVLPWESVTTIVLHTAGFDETYDEAGHPVGGMHRDRWLGVPCHVAVSNAGEVVLCHHLNVYLYAAHAANRFSCSLEIAGNQTITPYQLPAARAALRYMTEELRRRRPGPVKIIPHRFTHRSRVDDPGPEIWSKVGEWGILKLGLQLGDVVGSGRPLPW